MLEDIRRCGVVGRRRARRIGSVDAVNARGRVSLCGAIVLNESVVVVLDVRIKVLPKQLRKTEY